jgi:hypothetical protein
MKSTILVLTLLCVGVALGQVPSSERNKPTVANAADPQAKAALDKMAGFLKTLKTFSIASESSRDEIVDADMKIQKSALNDISVQMPDRFHANVNSDDHNLQVIYDGAILTLFSPKMKYYASTPTPPTISRTLDAIRARFGIVLPVADFIQMASGENLFEDITDVGYIGVSQVDGVDCDHIAVRQPEVDWQVWIERSASPVPRKVVITTKTQPMQPQYTAKLRWNLSPTIDNRDFTFTRPPDAVRIKFARANDARREQ